MIEERGEERVERRVFGEWGQEKKRKEKGRLRREKVKFGSTGGEDERMEKTDGQMKTEGRSGER